MRLELFFNGTPYQFARIALDYAVSRLDGDKWSHLFIEWPQCETCKPDADYTAILIHSPETLRPPEYRHPASVTAELQPSGQTRLIVEAENTDWPGLAEWWELLHAEMKRLGRLDAQLRPNGNAGDSNVTIIAQSVNIGSDVAGRDITKEPPSRQPATSAALGDGLSAKGEPTSYDLANLRQNLAKHFNIDELRTLCFDLGIEHENLPETKDGMARELVAYCERTGKIPELVAQCRTLRPNVSWEEVP